MDRDIEPKRSLIIDLKDVGYREWKTEMRMERPAQYPYLEILSLIAEFIAKRSNITWRVTSWVRPSVTHNGESLDIAPYQQGDPKYAHTNGSDPILTRRVNLRKFLIEIAPVVKRLAAPHSIEIYIETHHLHITVHLNSLNHYSVWLWDVPGIYNDSEPRRDLPAGTTIGGSTLCDTPPPFERILIFMDSSNQ